MGKKKTTRKSKYIGVVIKELRTKGKVYKVNDTYDAIDKGSYEYLINAGYISGK